MGRVYEALQRAEEQRARHAAEAGAAHPARALGGIETPPKAGRLSFWRRLLQRRPRTTAEDASSLNKRRIAMLQPQSFVTEQFRSLRARLESIAVQRPLRTIAVTSAVAGEGKTTTAVNLALVMSMSLDRRVLLVDCDLRRPRVHYSLGVRVEAGLAEVLRGDVEPARAIHTVDGSSLHVLPVRDLPSNPAELLAGAAMRNLVDKLAGEYDRVILDVPPILGLPDGQVVADLCDGVLIVVRANSTLQEDAAAVLDVIDRDRVVGAVLNESDATPSQYGYGD